jgi:hypothetical protein
VALAKVFSTVDEEFIDAWVDQAGTGHSNGPPGASRHMSKLLDPSSTAGTVSPSEIDEIQRLDIAVTQQWLRVLTCQLNIRRSLRHPSNTDPRTIYASYSQYVADSARSLLHTITAASPKCLEAHGIGMVRITLWCPLLFICLYPHLEGVNIIQSSWGPALTCYRSKRSPMLRRVYVMF